MATTAIIQNLESEVILRVENQTTQTARADVWIRDTLLEMSSNPEFRDSFPELEVLGPQFNLTGGTITSSVQEYPESNFYNVNGGVPDFNVQCLDFMIWLDFPTNQQRRQLNPTNFQDSDKFQSFPSLPTEWYRFNGNIGFNPPPFQNYQVQARYMRRHPFTDFFNTNGMLNQTTILMPLEWNEVIEWGAAMRGFMELLQFEKATEIRTMLWGDPDHPTDHPGLIAAVKNRRQAEAWHAQQPLRPIVKESCWGQ